MFIAVIIVLVSGFLIGQLIYQLKTGTLLGRGWKIYAHRQDNPMLYWSSVIVEAIIVLAFVGFWLLAVLGSKNPKSF